MHICFFMYNKFDNLISGHAFRPPNQVMLGTSLVTSRASSRNGNANYFTDTKSNRRCQ